MTTNQTIDGVPRELLASFAAYVQDSPNAIMRAKVKELRALLDAPAPCAHEWTDDGAHLLVCTACGEQENHDPGWRDMATAPTNGTMVRLLVEFDEHSTEDEEQAITIGANNLDNDEEDAWRFAGWCWSHDHFTEGKGTPVGWLPMLDDPVSKPAATPPGEPVAIVDEGDDGLFIEFIYGENGNPLQRGNKLYAEQPAPVAVTPKLEMAHIVRAHMEIPGFPVLTSNQCYELAMKLNDCIDEVTRLNAKPR